MKTSHRKANQLTTKDQVVLADDTTVNVIDVYPTGVPGLTWLELSNGDTGATPNGTTYRVIA